MMDEYKPSAPNSVCRSIQDQFSDFLSVKNFGAVGDGVTNDAPSIQAACTAAALTGRGLRFPHGEYKLLSAITVYGKIALLGESRANTKLVWPADANSEGVTINLGGSGGFSDMAEVEKLQFISGSKATGTALKIVGAPKYAPDRVTSRAVIRDVVMRNKTDAFLDGWAHGLVLTNCTNTLVDCLTFWGKINSSGEPNYDSQAAITYDNANNAYPHPCAVTISNCFIAYAKTGISAYDFEGAIIRGNQVMGVNTGISVDGPLNYPHASIVDNHCNASDVSVVVSRIAQAIIHGNLFYNQLGNGVGIGISVVNGANFFSIQGNIFENLKANIGMNSVVVSSGDKGLISNNNIRRANGLSAGLATGIWLTSGATGCVVGTNAITGTANPVIDSGSGNIVAGSGSNWTSSVVGTTSQYDSQALSLDTNGDAVINLPKPYRSAHKSAIVCNGNPDFSAAGLVFGASSLTLSSFKVSVRPNPGPIAVQVNWHSCGV